MKKLELKEAKEFDASGHFGNTALRLHHKDTTGIQSFHVGLSYFLPGGGAKLSVSEFDRVYYVISGTITVEDEQGNEIVLRPTDSLYIETGEKRSVLNKTKEPVTMIVVGSYPK